MIQEKRSHRLAWRRRRHDRGAAARRKRQSRYGKQSHPEVTDRFESGEMQSGSSQVILAVMAAFDLVRERQSLRAPDSGFLAFFAHSA